MSTTSVRGQIIAKIFSRFNTLSGFNDAAEMSTLEPEQITAAIADGDHFVELNFGDSEPQRSTSSVTGVDVFEMQVVAFVTLAGAPESGQSLSEYASDISAQIQELYADGDDAEKHTWDGLAIDTWYAGGDAPFIEDGRNAFIHAFRIKYRHTFGNPGEAR